MNNQVLTRFYFQLFSNKASDENDGTSVDSKVVEDIKKRLFQAKLRHENKANRKKRNQRRFIVYNGNLINCLMKFFYYKLFYKALIEI